MKKIRLGTSNVEVGEISLGCMRMGELPAKEADRVLRNAVDLGVDLFDHADIYGAGKAEEVFGDALRDTPSLREKIRIQTKCGIREGFFDFSREHILGSVEASLERLKTDYLDILLLHRPDALMEPEEVAEAFTSLKESGKVRHFGVSNQNPAQMELLRNHLREDLIVNQLQFSIVHTPMLDAGLNVNMRNDPAVVRDGGVLDYCRLHNITIQAWSPFQYGMIEGAFIGNESFPAVNAKLSELARAKGTAESAVAIAWILRHPAQMQPIVGTMKPARLREIAKASDIELTRREWYDLYRAGGKALP
jgi:predicted oxidoreductase